MEPWPSHNQATLMGKVSRVVRIQWEDGSVSALLDLTTRKKIVSPTGFSTGYDHHQVELSPGQKVIQEVWPGAIVLVSGPIASYRWKGHGAQVEVNRHLMKARTYQLVKASPAPRPPVKTVLRKYREELIGGGVSGHDHTQTNKED